MDTLQLTKLCEFAKSFLGVYPSDKLPATIPTPCSMIINTKPSGHDGEHWVAIYFNKENYADYFCSYGIEPDSAFIRFMKKHSKAWNYTTKRLQSNFATTCGQYCVFFIFLPGKRNTHA